MNFTHEIQNNCLIIVIEDNLLQISDDAKLFQLVDESIENKIRYCAVDLSKIEYVNSIGLGLLVRMLVKFRNKGGELVLIKPGEKIYRLLIITKLNNIFTTVASQQDAIRFLKENT